MWLQSLLKHLLGGTGPDSENARPRTECIAESNGLGVRRDTEGAVLSGGCTVWECRRSMSTVRGQSVSVNWSFGGEGPGR